MFESFLSWVTAEKIGVILAAIPIVWVIFQYISIKRAEAQKDKFENYHDLIKQLVQPETSNQPMKLDRQVAIVFELRNFSNYFPVTIRILKGLREDWNKPAYERLINEIDLAIKHIQKKQTCFLFKIFN